jgi:hypothetical protein
VDLQAVTGATEEYDGSTWTSGNPLNTARNGLAGAGTQTAALAFGGEVSPAKLQEQQKNMMDQLGQQSRKFKYCKICFSRCWYSNCWFSFWWR